MRLFWIILSVIAVGGIVQYLFYINGFLIVKAIRALVFRGSARRWWRNNPAAKVISCSGWVRKVIKYKESRQYQFTFDADISKGSITAEIQNRNKEPILTLDAENAQGVLEIDSSERYYLVVRFKKATGSFEMRWT